jgi:hypothetical protein
MPEQDLQQSGDVAFLIYKVSVHDFFKQIVETEILHCHFSYKYLISCFQQNLLFVNMLFVIVLMLNIIPTQYWFLSSNDLAISSAIFMFSS